MISKNLKRFRFLACKRIKAIAKHLLHNIFCNAKQVKKESASSKKKIQCKLYLLLPIYWTTPINEDKEKIIYYDRYKKER